MLNRLLVRMDKAEIFEILFFEDKKIYSLNSPGCSQFLGNENCKKCISKIQRLCVEFTRGNIELSAFKVY